MTAIAMANFANNGNVTACARNHSKVRIMSASLKFTGKIDRLTIVLGPPKPAEEHGNKLEAAYCAAEGANSQPGRPVGLN
jgi:hypothetical protein